MLGSALAHGVDQGQGGLALGQVVAHVLAQCLGVTFIVEQVVDQLESHAQVVTEHAQGLALGIGSLGQGRSTVGGGFEQHGGLAADDVHVDVLGGAGVANPRQLQHFTLGNDPGRPGQDLHDRHRPQLDHHLERAGIEEITDQHAWGVAPQGVGRGAAAAHARHVDHVIVQQGGGVQEFDGCRQQPQVVAPVAQGLAAQQHQQWAQALATGRRDIVADLRYQRHARGQLLLDDLVDGAEIVSHRTVEGLGLHRLLQ